MKDKLANFLTSPGVLRPIFTFLRRFFPVAVLGKNVIVTRFDSVVDVLRRDEDFTISQINAPKIDRIEGPFILGMDKSPQYDQEKAVLLAAVRREDLDRIRQFAGVRFEPSVVNAFVRAYERGALVPIPVRLTEETEEPMLREAL